MNLYTTQLKREVWENKVSFIYTPIIVSILILVLAVCAALYSNGAVNSRGVHFNFTSNGVPVEAGVSVAGNTPDIGVRPSIDDKKDLKHFDIKSSVIKDSTAFNGMVMGVMYANCAMLYLVFSIVMSAYSLRCLFDDRKNKDILFWRSMPVSETTNVLIKVGMVLVVGPLVMLLLNLLITLIAFVFGLVFFGVQGIQLSYLIASVTHGGAFFIPLQIFYELVFSLLMTLPIIGFAFLASAFAKKTPFFIFASPAILALADKILDSVFGIDIGFIDALAVYGRALVNVKSAFILQEAFVFNQTMILPFIICVGVGSLFVAGSIWLRNNRYEI
jgi:ABC-2 type transport system permease protein